MHKRKLILILLIVLQQAFCSWVPKVVWTFWNKPIQQEDHLIKALHHNHIQKLGPDWQIKYIQESKFGEWANRIPKLKEAYEHPFWQELGDNQRSDLVKLAILGQEGGVYLSMTLIMTEGLNWLLNMTSNPLIENKYGQEPNLFYTYPKRNYLEKFFDEETNHSFLIGPSMEMFFIASKTNNSYLNEWVSFVVDTKIQTYSQYRLLDKASVILDIAKKEELELGGFPNKHFEIGIAGMILLARKQDALDKQWKADLNKKRSLVVKDLKIWTVDSTKSAYMYFNFNRGFLQSFLKTNKKIFHVSKDIMTPFVSFWDEICRQILDFLLTDNKDKCDPQFYLLEESLLYQQVLKDYPIKFYKIPLYSQQSFEQQCTVLGEAKNSQKKLDKIKQQFVTLKKPLEILQDQVYNISKNNKIGIEQLANTNERHYEEIMKQLTKEKEIKQSILKKLKQRRTQNLKSDEQSKLKEKDNNLGKAESQISKGAEQGIKQFVDPSQTNAAQQSKLNENLLENKPSPDQIGQKNNELLFFGSIISILIILTITLVVVLYKKFFLELQDYSIRQKYRQISNYLSDSFGDKSVTSDES